MGQPADGGQSRFFIGGFLTSLTPHGFQKQSLGQRRWLVENRADRQCLLELLDAFVTDLVALIFSVLRPVSPFRCSKPAPVTCVLTRLSSWRLDSPFRYSRSASLTCMVKRTTLVISAKHSAD